MAVMNLPNIEFYLILGRAVFLVFSFALAAVTFTAWRRATRRQTEQVLAQNRSLIIALEREVAGDGAQAPERMRRAVAG